MRLARVVVLRLRSVFRRSHAEADLQREIDLHFEQLVKESIAAGMSEADARPAAQRQFGPVELIKEQCRDMRHVTFVDALRSDLRYGSRTLRHNPLFATMATLSLALGIGANTAIFSFMDAILLRALPVHHPGELVILHWHTKGFPHVVHSLSGSWTNDPHTGCTSGSLPFPAFQVLQANNSVLSGIFAFSNAGRLNLSTQGRADLVDGEFVSGNFFGTLNVNPAMGRLIDDEDDRSSAAPVVVISSNYWRSGFAAKDDVIGQSIVLNGMPFTVIGVTAPEFFGVDSAGAPDLFLPLHAAPVFAAVPREEERRRFFDRNFYWVEVMGRLQPSIRLKQAQTDLAARFQRYITTTASTDEEKVDLPVLLLAGGGSGLDSLRSQYSKPLYVLMTMVGLILAIACANIANLLLVRAAARRREMAVRLSLGASRLRVICQLLTESLLLAFLGGLLAVWVAGLGIRFLTWLLTNGRATFTLHASLNWLVLGFTFALVLIAAVGFGLAPAVQATRVDVMPALKEVSGNVPRNRLRLNKLLVLGQIGISVLLIIAAGLFVRTLINLQAVELGFDREHVLLFRVNARQVGYRDVALVRLYTDLLSRFRTIPGVRDVTLSDLALVSGAGTETGVIIPGVTAEGGRQQATAALKVGPTFFTTMHIPILLGREIEERDLTGPSKVAVINEVFAKRYFIDENPIGRYVGLGDKGTPDIEIIGVAKAAKYNSLKRAIPPVLYVPFSQNAAGLNAVSFEVRTVGDPLASANTVREIVHQAEPRLPVSGVNTQSRLIGQTINQERIFAQLCSCFATLALLMSCVGLYGTMAYSVVRRTGEFGLRMALGAARPRIISMVLSETIWLAAVGLAIGLAAVWGTVRYLESFLFGVNAKDPLSLLGPTTLLVVALISAGCIPAIRASRIDPLAALRHE